MFDPATPKAARESVSRSRRSSSERRPSCERRPSAAEGLPGERPSSVQLSATGWGGLPPPEVPSSAVPGSFRHVDTPVPQHVRGTRTDRYGWKVVDEELSLEERRRQALESEIELRREEKWVKMLGRWDHWQGRNLGKLQERIRKGIPDCLRGRAWQMILDPSYERDLEMRPTVTGLIGLARKPCCHTIEVDLERTLPKVAMFRNKDVLGSLRNILHAYSNLDAEVGYVQGMAFTAGMFLCYMDEVSAFWCFTKIMAGPWSQSRKLFIENFRGLKHLTRVWEVLLTDKFKKIADNFKANAVVPELYTTQWFLPAFMNLNFHPEIRMRVFDRYISFGCKALLSFGLAILATKQEDLEKKKAGDIFPILQKPESCEEMKQWRTLLQKYEKYWLSDKEYEKAFKRADVPLFN
jgi:hypothetical protein